MTCNFHPHRAAIIAQAKPSIVLKFADLQKTPELSSPLPFICRLLSFGCQAKQQAPASVDDNSPASRQDRFPCRDLVPKPLDTHSIYPIPQLPTSYTFTSRPVLYASPDFSLSLLIPFPFPFPHFLNFHLTYKTLVYLAIDRLPFSLTENYIDFALRANDFTEHLPPTPHCGNKPQHSPCTIICALCNTFPPHQHFRGGCRTTHADKMLVRVGFDKHVLEKMSETRAFEVGIQQCGEEVRESGVDRRHSRARKARE